MAGISHLHGLGMPSPRHFPLFPLLLVARCNELVAKCGLKAAAESSAVLYMTIAIAVSGLEIDLS